MREITMREFLRSPKSVLPPPTEGIKVLRRDGDDFFIYPDVRQKEEDVRQMSDNSTIPPENIPAGKTGWCELHFEKGVEYPLTLISWEDENGYLVVDKKWACPKCVLKYENLGKGKVYYG